MKLKNKVSIIMPSYGSEKFISRAIESAIKQTYKNWELIVVDDNSFDQSNIIIENYTKMDSRIKLIKLYKNEGPAIARNCGIKASQGRFVAFLDADDMWMESKLEEQLEFMMQKNLSFTYSGYYLTNEENKDLGEFIPKDTLTYRDMLKSNSIGCLTAIYDSEKLGKMFMPNIKRRQDYALWMKIIKKTGEVKGISKPLAIYRIRKKSISSNKLIAAAYQWKVYREIEKLNLAKSAYYFLHYTINGFTKYKK